VPIVAVLMARTSQSTAYRVTDVHMLCSLDNQHFHMRSQKHWKIRDIHKYMESISTKVKECTNLTGKLHSGKICCSCNNCDYHRTVQYAIHFKHDRILQQSDYALASDCLMVCLSLSVSRVTQNSMCRFS